MKWLWSNSAMHSTTPILSWHEFEYPLLDKCSKYILYISWGILSSWLPSTSTSTPGWGWPIVPSKLPLGLSPFLLARRDRRRPSQAQIPRGSRERWGSTGYFPNPFWFYACLSSGFSSFFLDEDRVNFFLQFSNSHFTPIQLERKGTFFFFFWHESCLSSNRQMTPLAWWINMF